MEVLSTIINYIVGYSALIIGFAAAATVPIIIIMVYYDMACEEKSKGGWKAVGLMLAQTAWQITLLAIVIGTIYVGVSHTAYFLPLMFGYGAIGYLVERIMDWRERKESK